MGQISTINRGADPPQQSFFQAMKLGEALIRRNQLDKELTELSDRCTRNCLVQEGIEPTENPMELLQLYCDKVAEYERASNQITMANLHFKLPNGLTIVQAVAKSEALASEIQAYRSVIQKASSLVVRARREIGVVTTVEVPDLIVKVEALQKHYNNLVVQLQHADWDSDLSELDQIDVEL